MAALSRSRQQMPFTSTLGLICLLTLFNLEPIKTSNVTSCHSQCVCLPNSTTVDCSNKGFSSVPSNLPRNSSLLLLDHNQLQTLSPEILSRLPLLKRINVSDNQINCDCTLSWVRNGSTNLEIIGHCSRPANVKGRSIARLTLHEMCNLQLTTTSSPVVKLEKETVSLNCQPSSPASIRWSKRNSDVNSQLQDVQTLGSRFWVLQNGTLVINNLQSTDQGEYLCFGEHKYGARRNKSIFLTIKPTCKINITSASDMPTVKPINSHYTENDVINLSCVDGFFLNGSAVLTCLADGNWDSVVFPKCQEILATPIPVVMTTMQSTVQLTTTPTTPAKEQPTKVSPTTPKEPPTTPKLPSTTPKGLSTTPTETIAKGSSNKSSTTSQPLPTTFKAPPNLTNIVKESNRTQLDAEALGNLVETLETDVYRGAYRDQKETKDFLHAASNLMRKENHATWVKVRQKSSGVERLLRTINKAMELHATEMLNGNNTDSFTVKYNNLDAEIQVGVGDAMAKKGVQFPSLRSRQDDYIEFPTSVFQKLGLDNVVFQKYYTLMREPTKSVVFEAICSKQKVAVIVIRFKQLDELLSERSLITDFDSFQTNSRILSASIISSTGSVSAPVKIQFKNKNTVDSDAETRKCVFWKYDQAIQTLNVSKGGWSDKGCDVSSSDDDSTTCQCDHMTDFVVLTQTEDVMKPLVIVYVGSLFLVGTILVAFVRNVFVWRQTRRERSLVLLNECVAIIMVAILVLIGVSLDYQKALCVVLAALMHWFVLAVFCWILIEEIQLYLSIHFGWSRSSSRLKYFMLLGWVVPAVIVGISLGITHLDYGSPHWCWYRESLVVHLTYVCPVVLCILFSVIVILKIVSIKSFITDDADKKDICVILAFSGFLIPLVVATCATAMLAAADPDKDVIQYLFAVFCIVLGIYIVVYHCWFDREITKMAVRENNKRVRHTKRDYYSTKETVMIMEGELDRKLTKPETMFAQLAMYSEGTSEGKSFSLIFPSRKSTSKKPSKGDAKRAKRTESASPFDYDSTVPMYPPINDSSLKSFRSQVSTQQHTLETPPNTLTAITISRPNSQCIELTSLSDLDRRPDGAEQTDAGEPSEFYGSRNSNPMENLRQRTSGSSDSPNAITFGKDSGRLAREPTEEEKDDSNVKNRISGESSAGVSRTSRSSVSGSSLGPVEESEINQNDDTLETKPFLKSDGEHGPEVRSDPPAKIPKRRKRGSRRRIDDEFPADETDEPKIKSKLRNSSSLPAAADGSVKLKHYTSI